MVNLQMNQIAEGFSVSPQLQPPDFPMLAAQGICTIINNRPDGEELGRLTAAEASELAVANGMGYRHILVTLASLSQDNVEQFADTLQERENPVHAHCRSGQRSVTLWAINEVKAGRMSREEIQARLKSAGYDAAPVLHWRDRPSPAAAP